MDGTLLLMLLMLSVSAVLFGLWGRSIAIGKGRSGPIWFVVSAVFGLTFWLGFVGIIVLLTLPRLNREISN